MAVFMSSNLITGFHNRLEGSRKYLFGSSGVYGENNNSKIQGAYMLRGAGASCGFVSSTLPLSLPHLAFVSATFIPKSMVADDYIIGCGDASGCFWGVDKQTSSRCSK